MLYTMSKKGLYTGAHTLHKLQYHIVFVPKYRKRVLRGEVATKTKRLFYQCAEMNEWWIEELEILPDHVHMLLRLPPNIALSKAVQLLKGGSSRVIRQEHPELEEWLWGSAFWAEGYFAETIGRVHESTIRKYINDQWKHVAK